MKLSTISYFALLIFVILTFSIIKTASTKESFLSGFHKMYRPYARHARLYTSNKFNSLSNKTNVFFRRWGII